MTRALSKLDDFMASFRAKFSFATRWGRDEVRIVIKDTYTTLKYYRFLMTELINFRNGDAKHLPTFRIKWQFWMNSFQVVSSQFVLSCMRSVKFKFINFYDTFHICIQAAHSIISLHTSNRLTTQLTHLLQFFSHDWIMKLARAADQGAITN